jgi:hypothetical protein
MMLKIIEIKSAGMQLQCRYSGLVYQFRTVFTRVENRAQKQHVSHSTMGNKIDSTTATR